MGYQRPLEEVLPAAERDALRARLLNKPGFYSPWLHLAVPSVFGLSAIAAAVMLLQQVTLLELLTVPVTWLAANITEWRAHKYILHRRNPIAPVLYDKHTPEHHMVYVTHDMAMRSNDEFRLVLIPAYGIMLVFLAMLVPASIMWLFGLHNVAALFVATTMGYVLGYEWLHLAYHLPPDSFIGRLSIIARLRHHHAVHHHPRLMQKWNFNVTVPLWDWVRGTIVSAEEERRVTSQSAVAEEA